MLLAATHGPIWQALRCATLLAPSPQSIDMKLAPTSRSESRIARGVLCTLGALIVLYSISDHAFYGGEPGFGRAQMLMVAAGSLVAVGALLLAKHIGSILLLVTSSLVVLLFAEIAGEFVLGPRHRPIFQFDERLIFKFIPGRCSVMTHTEANGGGMVRHCINAQGFRGPDLRPTGQSFRVVVYGDSFIHGYYSPAEETFASRLGARLPDASARSIEIVNAGVSSYGPDQIALKMEHELPWLQPDLVIVSIFAGNDYGDLLRNKLFELDAVGNLVTNSWKLDPKVRTWLELSQRESILVRAMRATLAASHSDQELGARISNLEFLLQEAEREYKSAVVERDDIVTNTHVDFYSADISLTPHSASAVYKVALMRQVVGLIQGVAKRNNVPLVILIIPHPLDVSGDHDWSRVDRKRYPEYNGRNQVSQLESIARSHGLPFVNVYDAFLARGGSSLYLRGGDDHWNAEGQQVAAELLGDYLMASGILRASSAVESASLQRGAQ